MRVFITFIFCVTFSFFAKAQNDWPKTINATNGSIIKMYQMQPESFTGNQLKYRSAFSVQSNPSADPTFGTFWALATVETDRDNRVLSILSVKIVNIKSSDDSDVDHLNTIKYELENQLPSIANDLQLEPILASLDMRTEEKKVSKGLNNNPPRIIYSDHPSLLVLIDGTPKTQYNADWGVNVVVNSPFTIVKTNNSYFLYGSGKWFYANDIKGPYQYTTNTPANFRKIETAVNNANNSDPSYSTTPRPDQSAAIPEIIVSTVPAELIQTDGPADFKPIEGTNLLYASNSDNDIFIDNNSQNYYVLASGRWYEASSLENSVWEYVPSNSLPADFAKIPEGSKKDNVLASVAGTDAVREAVMDAQIPQTAKVDRNKASADVTYDGNPEFENIDGTSMQYAVNTQNSVIRYKDRYYCVENGVWFDAPTSTGPWSVCVERPEEVDIIPPSYPVYNMKYVYIYDSNPDYVYMGYTPGYLNSFIYGSTVVYGTGFYYRPWMGRHYYPRPYTWGFGMNYNPWSGWGLGFDYSFGWFNMGFGVFGWPGWCGGWWGPRIYHPPFRLNPYGRNYGYYGRGMASRGISGRGIGGMNSRIYGSRMAATNIYSYRRDVVSGNRNIAYRGAGRSVNSIGQRGGNPGMQQRSQSPQLQQRGIGNNNVVSDRQGNVYRNQQGQWQQQNQQRQWQNVQPQQRQQTLQNLNRTQQMQQRGETRTQNFQSQRNATYRAAPATSGRPSSGGRSSGGGGSRGSGGGHGR